MKGIIKHWKCVDISVNRSRRCRRFFDCRQVASDHPHVIHIPYLRLRLLSSGAQGIYITVTWSYKILLMFLFLFKVIFCYRLQNRLKTLLVQDSSQPFLQIYYEFLCGGLLFFNFKDKFSSHLCSNNVQWFRYPAFHARYIGSNTRIHKIRISDRKGLSNWNNYW